MRTKDVNRYYRGPPSDHFDGVRFFVPGHDTLKTARDLLRWHRENGRKPWPKQVENSNFPPPAQRVFDGISVTFIGHATALIQISGLNLLTDPFFSRRASPTQLAGPTRVRPPGVALKDLPPIDAVLLSHNHYDHMDLPSLRRLHETHAPRILTPIGNGTILKRTRRRLMVEEGDWSDVFDLGHGVRVTMTPALHWSKRGFHDRNMALWCAFHVASAEGSIYFAADTGYGSGEHFRTIRSEFGPPDLALLPIGAYEPRWFMRAQHMNPEEAVKAHLDLGARASLAIHHGTIQLTDEGIDEPARALAAALRGHGVAEENYRVTEPGETWKLPLRRGGRRPRPDVDAENRRAHMTGERNSGLRRRQ